jgi:hypothetical protein
MFSNKIAVTESLKLGMLNFTLGQHTLCEKYCAKNYYMAKVMGTYISRKAKESP